MSNYFSNITSTRLSACRHISDSPQVLKNVLSYRVCLRSKSGDVPLTGWLIGNVDLSYFSLKAVHFEKVHRGIFVCQPPHIF
ncbi:unnamed protein product [Heligmosomoides polygyrus]|uniref:Ovule protein n=1 Tax=Heligmosomoides polygyrus TaxID=6339 RepID=A0A183GBU1_HELPZ|nr:unnamed protein product [Heligmosomoides polygyrus]